MSNVTPQMAAAALEDLAYLSDWLAYPETDDDEEPTGLWSVHARYQDPETQQVYAVVLGQAMPEHVAKELARLPDYLTAYAETAD